VVSLYQKIIIVAVKFFRFLGNLWNIDKNKGVPNLVLSREF
jgi:hypothetical protein